MQPKSKLPTILIVLLTVGLVFGPVFIPREVSRWYLAAAANAFRVKDSVLGEHYLTRAEAWDPAIKKDADYWIAQLPSNSHQSTDELLDLIERAVMTDMRWKVRAQQAAEVLSEGYDFAHAVRALKIAALNQRPSSAEDLNELAYMRALAGIELDEALKDIDLALELYGKEPSLLDTKAWVLQAMNRNVEALALMKDAIEGMEQLLINSGIPLPQPLEVELPQADDHSGAQASTSADQDLEDLLFLETLDKRRPYQSLSQRQAEIKQVKKRLGDGGYALAVMRFHRLRILEALSRNTNDVGGVGKAREAAERAEQDRRWLVERGVPVVDELF